MPKWYYHSSFCSFRKNSKITVNKIVDILYMCHRPLPFLFWPQTMKQPAYQSRSCGASLSTMSVDNQVEFCLTSATGLVEFIRLVTTRAVFCLSEMLEYEQPTYSVDNAQERYGIRKIYQFRPSQQVKLMLTKKKLKANFAKTSKSWTAIGNHRLCDHSSEKFLTSRGVASLQGCRPGTTKLIAYSTTIRIDAPGPPARPIVWAYNFITTWLHPVITEGEFSDVFLQTSEKHNEWKVYVIQLSETPVKVDIMKLTDSS